MIAEELALYLQSKGKGTQNKDLFVDFQPDEPNDCITVYDESTSAPSESQALSVDEFGAQILIRNTNNAAARDKAMAIHKLLVGYGGLPFVEGGEDISVVYIETPPTTIGKDDKGRSEWSSHYRVRVVSKGDEYRL